MRLIVYDLLGREVATLVDKNQFPGHQFVEVGSGRFASGVYVYRLTAGTYVSTKKMIVVK